MRHGLLLLCAFLATACGSTPEGPDYEAAWRAEPELQGADRDRFAAALDELAAGHSEPARDELLVLARRRSEVFVLQRWLQEAELAIARERADYLRTAEHAEGLDPLRDLRESYRARAEDTGTATDLLLAARLESDPPAALHLVDRALAADPEEDWAWYGRAHVLVRMGEWSAAREALRRCLELEPRHLAGLRLSAWVQAEAGSRGAAISELERWLALSAGDPTVGQGERDAALLDLALMLLQEGEEDRAETLLIDLADSGIDAERRHTALAAVYQARDEPLEALKATERARAADPDALMPVVQQALLVENHFDDPQRALELWRLTVKLSLLQDDLGAVLQRTRAQVHIGRLEARLAAQQDQR